MSGKRTWVALPKERWPKEWHDKGYVNPICPLVLNLYGHPLAGNVWGEDCEKRVLSCGWEKIPNWPCVYWHPHKKALLVVYVDDFKLAAPKRHIAGLWKELQKKINLDAPTPPERFLGCYTRRFECAVTSLKPFLEMQPELCTRGPLPERPAPTSTVTRGKSKSKSKVKKNSGNATKNKHATSSSSSYTSGRYGVGLTLCLLHAQRLVPNSVTLIITSTKSSDYWTIRRYRADTEKDEIVCLKEERLPKIDKEECGTIVEVLVPVS